MTQPEPTQFPRDWLADRQRSAQIRAQHWAEAAEEEYRQALEHEGKARGLEGLPFTTDEQAKERLLAGRHDSRANGAIRLARMWAHVASVLVPQPEPLEPMSAEVAQFDV